MHLLEEVLKEIKPTSQEEKEFKRNVNKVLTKLNANLNNATAILGGSAVKNTWLRNTREADIFVCFDYKKYKDKNDKLSDILERILKKVYPDVIRLPGSRDYFQIKQNNFRFEIVPILKIKEAKEALNITDVSPLHARWVLNHMKKNKRIADEIRLLKQFCKAAKCYGAESYIRGFSGYVCEILIVYYKNFMNLIKDAVNWKENEVIDIEGYYKNKDPLKILNPSKLSPLIVIDPVQKDRNAAAALSKEKFLLFKERANQFIRDPSKEFFIIKKLDINKLKELGNLVVLDVAPLEGKEDIIGCKLVKALNFVAKQLKKNGFNLIEYGWDWDKEKKASFYFITNQAELPKIRIRRGPPIKATYYVKKFKEKHKETFVKHGRIYAKVKRKLTKLEEIVKEIINQPYVRDKVKRIKIK